MPTVMADTRSPKKLWNGTRIDRFTNMYPRIGTFFGMLMDLVGVLERKITSNLEVIGIEVSHCTCHQV
jgi:hypothetical protein